MVGHATGERELGLRLAGHHLGLAPDPCGAVAVEEHGDGALADVEVDRFGALEGHRQQRRRRHLQVGMVAVVVEGDAAVDDGDAVRGLLHGVDVAPGRSGVEPRRTIEVDPVHRFAAYEVDDGHGARRSVGDEAPIGRHLVGGGDPGAERGGEQRCEKGDAHGHEPSMSAASHKTLCYNIRQADARSRHLPASCPSRWPPLDARQTARPSERWLDRAVHDALATTCRQLVDARRFGVALRCRLRVAVEPVDRPEDKDHARRHP